MVPKAVGPMADGHHNVIDLTAASLRLACLARRR
jgi:hypothetical protein